MNDDTIEVVKAELKSLENITKTLIARGVVQKLPMEWAWSVPSSRQGAIEFTILALVHGNEVAGLRVVRELFEFLNSGGFAKLPFTLNILLGNVDAALKGVRFIASDLNRSFGRDTADTSEQKRASQLEAVLRRSRFMLDIHQTREPSVSPFFIFPYTPEGVCLAECISASMPIVTHWGDAFSKDGQCTDEYVIAQGGCGITIEIGQNSFQDFSVSACFRASVRAIGAVSDWVAEQAFPKHRRANPLYTWSVVQDYPADGRVSLEHGLINFLEVQKGQKLGKSAAGDLLSPERGKILFPYYRKANDTRNPSELFRILKEIDYDVLGTAH